MATASQPLHILVIGGGPSGLAAALLLAQGGIPVRIVDKVRAFHKMSRGSGIQPRTTEMYQFLGVLDDMRKYDKGRLMVQSYKSPGGIEVEKRWHISEKVEPTPDRPQGALLISQYETEGVLREHLAKYNVHVELGTEPVSIEQNADGVAVTLKKVCNNGIEATEDIRAAYVVGADGTRGITRKLIGATFEGETKDADGAVFADAAIEGLTSEYWHMWTQPEKFTVTARPKLNDGEFHLGILGHNFDPIDFVDKQKFVDFFYEATGRKDLVFKDVAELTYWKPNMRMANKFYDGRIFIVGDAAHIHSPTGGQGLNTSVQDSINLAWKITLVHKGLAPPTLLETYQDERLPVVAQMLSTTTKLYGTITKLIEGGGASPSEAPAGGAQKSAPTMWTNKALRQLDVNYRWSKIVHDTRFPHQANEESGLRDRAYDGYPGEDVRAGDRAPEAPGLVGADGAETTLFTLFKPTLHTILVFTPGAAKAAEDIVRAAQECPANTVQTAILCRDVIPKGVQSNGYYDKEGHAHRAYQVQERVVVVRPDGYVGAIVDDADGVRAYFSGIFQGN